MTDYQVTYWRDLPSLVVARDGDETTKVTLGPRFQAAIDEAAMRLGDVASDAYLMGWTRGPWTPSDGSPADVAERVVADLEDRWPVQEIRRYLDSLGPAQAQA